MEDSLKNLLSKIGLDNDNHYLSDDGKVMHKGIFDSFTGIYKDDNGNFRKKGILLDEYLGLNQNNEGEFINTTGFLNSDTNIYENRNGDLKEKGILVDSYTQKNIRNRSWFDKASESLPDSNSEGAIVKYGIIFAFATIVLAVVFYLLTLATLISPLILIIVYLVGKREKDLWAGIGILISLCLIYLVNDSNGWLATGPMQIHDTTAIKYMSVFYSTSAILLLFLWLDKFTILKFPFDEESNNTFISKPIKDRRIVLSTFGTLLLIGLFFFFNSSDNIKPTHFFYQTTTGVSIREMDSITSSKIGSLASNSQVEVLGKGKMEQVGDLNDYWYEIKTGENESGYVYGAYLINVEAK